MEIANDSSQRVSTITWNWMIFHYCKWTIETKCSFGYSLDLVHKPNLIPFFFSLKHDILWTNEKLPKIYLNSKFCPHVAGKHSTKLYADTNEKIEQITKYCAYVIEVAAISLLILPLLYTIVNYCMLDLARASFFLFFPTWFVFVRDLTMNFDTIEKRNE